eukprot:symbB.v1.2.028121.t1/scaffold2940.1/size66828/1
MTELTDGYYRLFGAGGSPYSVKVRSYLLYKRIQHQWLVRNSAERMQEHQKYAKLPLVPTLVTPEGKGLQDSTPIIEQLEVQFPERSIYPSCAVGKFMSQLLEEFGDEWGNKWMMHYRWYGSFTEMSAEVTARRTAAEFCSGSPDPEAASVMAASFKKRMLDRGFTVGSNAETAPIIEKSYLDTLQHLEKHLGGPHPRPFLFGKSPSLADFGLAGQLYQCFLDVEAGVLMRLYAPHVALWCEVMANPHEEGPFEDWETLAPTLEPLIASQVKLFLRWSDANAKALDAKKKDFVVDLGDGQVWSQSVGGPQRYHAKSLKELRRKFSALDSERQEVEAVLQRCGCLELLTELSSKL